MRKVMVSEMVTPDGFFAGPNGEIDWHVVLENKANPFRERYSVLPARPKSIINLFDGLPPWHYTYSQPSDGRNASLAIFS